MYIPHIRQFDPIDIEAMSCLRLSWVSTSFNRDVSEASCFFHSDTLQTLLLYVCIINCQQTEKPVLKYQLGPIA